MKTVELSGGKTLNPCTYKQVRKMREFDTFHTAINNTQIMKRLSIREASEIIQALIDGEKIELV